MEIEKKLRSEENLEKMQNLVKEVGFQSVSLTTDPRKSLSQEAIIDGINSFLEQEKNHKKKVKPIDSFTI